MNENCEKVISEVELSKQKRYFENVCEQISKKSAELIELLNVVEEVCDLLDGEEYKELIVNLIWFKHSLNKKLQDLV